MTDFFTWTREVATLLYRWSLQKKKKPRYLFRAEPSGKSHFVGYPVRDREEWSCKLLQRLPWDSVFSCRSLGPGIKWRKCISCMMPLYNVYLLYWLFPQWPLVHYHRAFQSSLIMFSDIWVSNTFFLFTYLTNPFRFRSGQRTSKFLKFILSNDVEKQL